MSNEEYQSMGLKKRIQTLKRSLRTVVSYIFGPNDERMHQTILPIDQYHKSDTFLSHDVQNLFEKIFNIQLN